MSENCRSVTNFKDVRCFAVLPTSDTLRVTLKKKQIKCQKFRDLLKIKMHEFVSCSSNRTRIKNFTRRIILDDTYYVNWKRQEAIIRQKENSL